MAPPGKRRKRRGSPGETVKVQQSGLAKFLGELEALVMDTVWQLGEATVHEVRNQLAQQGHSFAYTTILTEMQNLEKKGLLTSHREGKRNVYRPTRSREAFIEEKVARTVQSLLQDFPEEVLTHLLPDAEVDNEVLELLNRIRERYQKDSKEA